MLMRPLLQLSLSHVDANPLRSFARNEGHSKPASVQNLVASDAITNVCQEKRSET